MVEREYNEDKDEEDEVSESDREDACYFYIPDKCENNISLGEIQENELRDNINEYYSNGEESNNFYEYEYDYGNKCSLL